MSNIIEIIKPELKYDYKVQINALNALLMQTRARDQFSVLSAKYEIKRSNFPLLLL